MSTWKPSYLWHGLPGHPLHPPLTDVTIGAYAFAVVAGILSKLGVVEHAFAQAWWLALVVAAVSSVLTVLTGLADWLTIEWGSELWTTATLHAVAMAIATVFFLLAILFGHARLHARLGDDGVVRPHVDRAGSVERGRVARRRDHVRARDARAQPRRVDMTSEYTSADGRPLPPARRTLRGEG